MPSRRAPNSTPTATRWSRARGAAGVGQIVLPAVDGRQLRRRARRWRTSTGWPTRSASTRCASTRAGRRRPRPRWPTRSTAHRDDPRLVAVGEIGLDHFVPGLDRDRQERFYAAQLKLARDARPAGDPARAALGRRAAQAPAPRRGARRHRARVQRQRRSRPRPSSSCGFKLGFGGAMTFERALQIRRLAGARRRRRARARDRRARHPAAVALPHRRRARRRRRGAQRAGRAAAHRARRWPRCAAGAGSRRRRSTTANARAALPRLRGLRGARRRPAAHRSATRRVAATGSAAGGSTRRTRLRRARQLSRRRVAAAQQYYGHPRNHFWPILSALWGVDLVALPLRARGWRDRARHGLGLWDVYASCRREGSLDSAIEEAAAERPARACARLRAGVARRSRTTAASRRARCGITRALGVPVFRLPSTSPANASWSFERKLAPGARSSRRTGSHDALRRPARARAPATISEPDGVRYLHLGHAVGAGRDAHRASRARSSSSTCSA